MNREWKPYKEYIVTITVALSGIFLVWFGILPLHKKINVQMNASQELLMNREIREKSVMNLEHIRKEKDFAENNKDQLKRIIAKSDIVSLVKDMESLARETNTTIVIDTKDQDAALSSPKNTKKTTADKDKEQETEKSLIETLPSDKRLLITIRLTGKYDDIVRFVYKLESMPYQTDVVAVSIAILPAESLENGRSGSVNIFSSNTDPSAAKTTTDTTSVTDEPRLLQAILDTVVYVEGE